MTDPALDLAAPAGNDPGPGSANAHTPGVTRLPRITIDAFCSTPETVAMVEAAFADRRMGQVRSRLHSGGTDAAIHHYQQAPTPNLVLLESTSTADELLAGLASLSKVCDIGTRVIVIGHVNVVALYRALLDLGIADYLVAPIEVLGLIDRVARVYGDPGAEKLGHTCAFIAAKGGAGSSTVAQNVAWTIADDFVVDVMLAEMDLAFGNAALNFNIDPGQGLAEALGDAARLDAQLLDRLLARRGDHLSLLAAPGGLKGPSELGVDTFDKLVDIAQSALPILVLDVPHLWTGWTRKLLLGADEVVITAMPDLANLQNAKSLIDLLRLARPNDRPPKLVLNQIGMPKRAEIKPQDFAAALEIEFAACIDFDAATFSCAANKGRMIGEIAPRARGCRAFKRLAGALTGRRKVKRAGNGIAGLVTRLLRRRSTMSGNGSGIAAMRGSTNG